MEHSRGLNVAIQESIDVGSIEIGIQPRHRVKGSIRRLRLTETRVQVESRPRPATGRNTILISIRKLACFSTSLENPSTSTSLSSFPRTVTSRKDSATIRGGNEHLKALKETLSASIGKYCSDPGNEVYTQFRVSRYSRSCRRFSLSRG